MPNAGPIIVAHRGYHRGAPENSLAAFRAAWDAGIAWCECDVQMTACFTPVVLHDDSLDRTTTAAGVLASRRWHELADVRLKTVNDSLSDETIPCLHDVLREMGQYNQTEYRKHLLIEIKSPCHDLLTTAVVSSANHRACAIQSFDTRVLVAAHQQNHRAPTYFLTECAADIARELDAPWTGINVRHDLLNAAIVERVHFARKQVGVWTPNQEEELRRVINLGVDWVITDEPLLAMKLVKGQPAEAATNRNNFAT